MRRQSSDSSDSDIPGNYDRMRSADPTSAERNISSGNLSANNAIAAAVSPAENISAIIGDNSSSGISMQPPSIDNTPGSDLW